MNKSKYLASPLSVAFLVAVLSVFAFGQVDSKDIARISSGGSSVRFDILVPHSGKTLTIIAPDGQTFVKEFKEGTDAGFTLVDSAGEKLPDGSYSYELRVAPIFSAEVKEALKAARAKGNESEVLRDLRKRGAFPSQATVQSGSFSVLNGTVILGGAPEKGDQDRAMIEQRPSPNLSSARSTVSTATPTASTRRSSYQIPRHHASLPFFDFVIADDLDVQGSACVGLDCVDGENFGFDTIRVKENNTRIQFDDTSTSAGFPNNNWQIRANDSGGGGTNFLGFVDQGATGNSETGTIVFAVNSGASANSLRVGSNSKVGLRTATPVLDVHANTTDTPAIRLEQNNTGGFTAQTWDIAGNEANFFVRDVTSGSRLPLRIRPGAPTSSVDIAADGNVGLGTASPAQRLHAHGAAAGLPATNGTLQNGIARFSQATGTGVVDLGFGGASGTGWIQATNSSNLATNFGLLLNPNGGNVGIGTLAPTQTLSVNGTAGKPGGGSWDTFSDERLKNIKGPFNSGLKAVMQLQPIRYEYKTNNAAGIKSEGEHVGFGAQAIQQIVPEAVITAANGYLMVNNDPIIWTMLNAIKEQQREIVELRRQIRQLRSTRRTRR